MVSNQSIYEYYLGNDLFLNLFALDPNITRDDLVNIVTSRDGTASELDLESLATELPIKTILPSIERLEVTVSDEQYTVPQQLQPYRNTLDKVLEEKGMFNGNIMVVKGNVEVPLTLYKGGFFDFKATQLTAIPADLLPDSYPAGKTIDELLPQYGLDVSQMARYLGFAFIMLPNNGNEISFVQRAKGLGIAADCMALSGATPQFHEDFLREGFDFPGYFRKVIKDEMSEEYKLSPDELRIGACYLIDDKKSVPFVAIEIITIPSTKEIAERSYGDKDIIKEHPILYATSISAVPNLIQRFPLLPSSAYVLGEVAKQSE